MTQPRQHLGDRTHDMTWRQNRPVNQDYSHAQRPGGRQLGRSPAATGIFGDDMGDGMGLQQRPITSNIKRTTCNDRRGIGQGQGTGPIHQAQQVKMLGLGGKGRKVLFAYRKEDAGGRIGQGCNSAPDIWHMLPIIALNGTPRLTLQCQKRNATGMAGLKSIPAHLRGKGVSGVNDMRDALGLNIGQKPRDASKPAHPRRQGLRHGLRGAPCIGKDGIHAPRGQGCGKVGGFGRSTQQEDAHG
jgi:hypothetical protein